MGKGMEGAPPSLSATTNDILRRGDPRAARCSRRRLCALLRPREHEWRLVKRRMLVRHECRCGCGAVLGLYRVELRCDGCGSTSSWVMSEDVLVRHGVEVPVVAGAESRQ